MLRNRALFVYIFVVLEKLWPGRSFFPLTSPFPLFFPFSKPDFLWGLYCGNMICLRESKNSYNRCLLLNVNLNGPREATGHGQEVGGEGAMCFCARAGRELAII